LSLALLLLFLLHTQIANRKKIKETKLKKKRILDLMKNNFYCYEN
jgi:hypothetical protein